MLEHRAALEPSIHEEDHRLQGMGPGMSGHQECGANGDVAPQTITLLDSRVARSSSVSGGDSGYQLGVLMLEISLQWWRKNTWEAPMRVCSGHPEPH